MSGYLPAVGIAAALLVSTVGSAPASADWIMDSLDPRCSTQARAAIAEGVRREIENSVRRAEASIEAPIPVGDLSCLADLMEAPLDIFSEVGDLLSVFQRAFDGSINTDGMSRQLCRFAARKWDEVTAPVTTGLDDLKGSAPGFTQNFGLLNLPDGSSEPVVVIESRPRSDVDPNGGPTPPIFPEAAPSQAPNAQELIWERLRGNQTQ